MLEKSANARLVITITFYVRMRKICCSTNTQNRSVDKHRSHHSQKNPMLADKTTIPNPKQNNKIQSMVLVMLVMDSYRLLFVSVVYFIFYFYFVLAVTRDFHRCVLLCKIDYVYCCLVSKKK